MTINNVSDVDDDWFLDDDDDTLVLAVMKMMTWYPKYDYDLHSEA